MGQSQGRRNTDVPALGSRTTTKNLESKVVFLLGKSVEARVDCKLPTLGGLYCKLTPLGGLVDCTVTYNPLVD